MISLDAMSVLSLYVYPIKSCAGTTLLKALVDARGIRHDRNWMFVDAQNQFLSQRELPQLALIRPELHDDVLALTAPNMPAIKAPLIKLGNRRKVLVWKSTCDAIDQGDEIAEWASGFLGRTVRLAHIADDFVRKVTADYARCADDQVGFADGFPFLMISDSSLADLNSRLSQALPMNRFRPNIVVTGCAPYAEDTWDQIQIGEIIFDLVKPCGRCIVTTTDQDSAERGAEPLKTLATYRKSERFGIQFGQNMIHRSQGKIRVGDRISLILKKQI